MSKKRVEAEDLAVLYDLAWGQFKEDRDAIMAQYEHLKEHIHDMPERYAMNGDTLAKYAELMIRQTAQIVELIKIAHKENKESDSLSEEDLKMISDEIGTK